MTGLRIVLLVLAAAVFVALGWHLSAKPDIQTRQIAANTKAVVPVPEPPPARPATHEPAESHQLAPPTTTSVPARSEQAAPGGDGQPPAPDPTATVQARLAAAPDLKAVFDAIRTAFPAVADRSMATATKALQTTGKTPSPDDIVAAAMRDLRQTAGVLAARASPEALAAIFEAKAATLADLEAADPRICADYVYGAASPEFDDFAAAHRTLVARQDLATVAAMADGRAKQIVRDAPSQEDYALIEAALKVRGLSADEIAAVLDGKSLDPPPSDTRLCDNARAYLDAMRAMPDQARNRVYGLAAELLARS